METEDKIVFLEKLGTKEIIERINRYEEDLEKKLYEEAGYRSLNAAHLGGYNSDSMTVDLLLSEKMLETPEDLKNSDQRKAWLTLQRKKDEQIQGSINLQKNITFELERLHIEVEMARRRLESNRAFLALRTAQIEFLRKD